MVVFCGRASFNWRMMLSLWLEFHCCRMEEFFVCDFSGEITLSALECFDCSEKFHLNASMPGWLMRHRATLCEKFNRRTHASGDEISLAVIASRFVFIRGNWVWRIRRSVIIHVNIYSTLLFRRRLQRRRRTKKLSQSRKSEIETLKRATRSRVYCVVALGSHPTNKQHNLSNKQQGFQVTTHEAEGPERLAGRRKLNVKHDTGRSSPRIFSITRKKLFCLGQNGQWKSNWVGLLCSCPELAPDMALTPNWAADRAEFWFSWPEVCGTVLIADDIPSRRAQPDPPLEFINRKNVSDFIGKIRAITLTGLASDFAFIIKRWERTLLSPNLLRWEMWKPKAILGEH